MKNLIYIVLIGTFLCAILNYETCLNVKRAGQQEDYCKANYVENFVECKAGFCLFCCREDFLCAQKCGGEKKHTENLQNKNILNGKKFNF
jgi:hypothetical protein